MTSKFSKWVLGFVHYIKQFTISRFVISRLKCTYLTNSRHFGIPFSFSKKNGSFGGTGIGLQNFDLICPDLHCEQFSKDPFGRRNIGVKLRSCAINCPHCIKCKVNLKKNNVRDYL